MSTKLCIIKSLTDSANKKDKRNNNIIQCSLEQYVTGHLSGSWTSAALPPTENIHKSPKLLPTQLFLPSSCVLKSKSDQNNLYTKMFLVCKSVYKI